MVQVALPSKCREIPALLQSAVVTKELGGRTAAALERAYRRETVPAVLSARGAY